jgi:Na+/proline symporter
MSGAAHLAMSGADLAVVAAYLVGIVGLGLWAWRRRRTKQASSAQYFLAGGALGWPVIGLALFSTNISTIHLVSLAQEGYINGLAYGNFEWMAAFLLIVLALFFAPFYIRARVATLPDFLEKRYSRASRDWLAGLSIVSAVFIHIGFSLYTGAVVLRGLFGIDVNTSILVTALLTGLYTIVGGLLAVVVTESVQTVVLILGSACVLGFGLVRIGGGRPPRRRACPGTRFSWGIRSSASGTGAPTRPSSSASSGPRTSATLAWGPCSPDSSRSCPSSSSSCPASSPMALSARAPSRRRRPRPTSIPSSSMISFPSGSRVSSPRPCSRPS